MALQRKIPSRIVPKRSLRRQPRVLGSVGRTQTQIRQEQKQEKELFTELEKIARTNLSNVSNINNITNVKNELFSINRGLLSQSQQIKFNTLLSKVESEVRSKQNSKINKLKSDILDWRRLESRADSKSKKAKKEGKDDRFISERAKEEKYRTRVSEGNKILERLTKGENISSANFNKFITDVSRQEQKRIEAKLKRKSFEAKKVAPLDETKTNKILNELAVKFSTNAPDNATIKREFKKRGVTLTESQVKQAFNVLLDVEKQTKKQIKTETQRVTSLLNKFQSFDVDRANLERVFSKKGANVLLQNLSGKGLTSAKQIQSFRKLSDDDRNVVDTFHVIKSVRNELPAKLKIVNQNEFSKIIITATGKKTAEQILKELDLEFKKVGTQDVKDMEFLKRLRDSDIKQAIINNDVKTIDRINSAFKGYNKFFEQEKRLQDVSIKSLINKTQNDLDKLLNQKSLFNSIKRNFISTITLQPDTKNILKIGKIIALKSQLVDLKQKQKKGLSISRSEYINYRDSLNDMLGVKAAFKNRSKALKSSDLRILAPAYFKFLGKVTSEAFLEIGRDLKFLGTVVFKVGIKPAISLGTDFGVQLAESVKRLPKKDRTRLFNETRKTLLPLKNVTLSAVELGKWARKNPELAMTGIAIGSALLISSGVKGSRQAIKKDPAKSLGFIVSFFLDDIIFGKLIKGAKIIRAKVDPTVLRVADVYEDSASVRVTAENLLKLEGKKVNLFSVTSSDLKKVFNQAGSTLSKADETRLIKDMLANPSKWMTPNFRIKKLSSITDFGVKRDIINTMKKIPNVFLSGSGALKLQLKSFRKIGDVDFIAKNARIVSGKVIDALNNKSVFGKLKIKRYKVRRKGADVFTIWDSGITGKRKYSTKFDLGDVVDLKKWETDFGRKLTKADLRKIDGLDVLKLEVQVPKKVELLSDPLFQKRFNKELRDLKIIFKNNKANLKTNKNFQLFNKAISKKKDVLRVKGFIGEAGLSRKYGWAEEILGDLRLGFRRDPIKEKKIIQKLKKVGLTDVQIRDNIRRFTPSDMYFAPNVIYSHYLGEGGKGGVIFLRDITISKYPKNIQKLINDNLKGLLNKKGQSRLQRLMREWRLKSTDKAFIGQKAVADKIGELELLIPEYSKIFAKKHFITRQVYSRALEKFIDVQEATLGKLPTKEKKKLFQSLAKKMKKGYKVSDMKKDITKWARKNIDDFQISKLQAKKEKKFIDDLTKSIDEQIAAVKKSKLTKTEQNDILKKLNRRKKGLTPKRVRGKFLATRKSINSLLSRTRKVIRKVKPRVVKRVKPVRRVKKVVRPTKRITKVKRVPKRVVKPKVRPVKRVVKRPVRPVKRIARKPLRELKRPPKKPVKKQPPKIPKIKIDLSWKKDLPRGTRYKVDGYIKVGSRRFKVVSGMPENKAWNRVFAKGNIRRFNPVDKSVARSFEFVIIGITKAKDDKRKIGTKKVRSKIGKNPKVLQLVEKSKFAIDTRGEKLGLRTFKKKKKVTKSKKKVKKRGNVKRSSTKRSNRGKTKKTPKKIKSKTKVKKRTSKKKKVLKKKR